MTDNELYSMFITVGQIVSAKIMRDKSSGYSYGYGFVHYQQPEDAAKAIASLNGLQVVFTRRQPDDQRLECDIHFLGTGPFTSFHTVC